MQRPHYFKKKKPADVNYNTPDWLFNVLDSEFAFQFDLAAVKQNAKARYFKDSLKKDWSKLNGWCFLNPPFAGIRQWIERAYQESRKGAKIVMLVPTTVLGGPYMAYCQPEEIRFHSGCPVFKNTFTEKIIRFMPTIMIFEKGRRTRKFSFFSKPKGE